MFEYLMPLLVMRSHAGTLLDAALDGDEELVKLVADVRRRGVRLRVPEPSVTIEQAEVLAKRVLMVAEPELGRQDERTQEWERVGINNDEFDRAVSAWLRQLDVQRAV